MKTLICAFIMSWNGRNCSATENQVSVIKHWNLVQRIVLIFNSVANISCLNHIEVKLAIVTAAQDKLYTTQIISRTGAQDVIEIRSIDLPEIKIAGWMEH